MAIIGALALVQGTALFSTGATFATGFWAGMAGLGITAGAGIIDSKFIMPGLLGDGNKPQAAKAQLLLQLPTMSLNPGSPRVWAIGQRVRVPSHMMFMTEKTRTESIGTPSKGGSQARISVNTVLSDVCFALNDRQNYKLAALLGDGRLYYWTDRNLLSIRTSGMSFASSSGGYAVTMASANEIDLTTRFRGRILREETVGSVTGGSGTTNRTFVITVTGASYATNVFRGKLLVAATGSVSKTKRWSIQSNTSNTITIWHIDTTTGTSGFAASDTFYITEPGDLIKLGGWDPSTANGFYQIVWIKSHGLTQPSSMLLTSAAFGQSPPSSAAAGSAETPATVARSDNEIIGRYVYNKSANDSTYAYIAIPGYIDRFAPYGTAGSKDYSLEDFGPTLSKGMTVDLRANSAALVSTEIKSIIANSIGILKTAVPGLANNNTSPTGLAGGTPFDLEIFVTAANNSPPELFEGVPEYWDGTQVLTSGIIAQHIDSADIPQFRGVSYIAFDEFNLTEFGNRVPNTEAVIDPDVYSNWQQAFGQVCDRVGLVANMRNLSKIARDPFDGYYLRGAVPGITALQPLMLAKEVVSQDRDGVLHFFPIAQCEVVSIRNGTDYSDFGAATDTGKADKKFSVAQVERTVLPSSVGVKHQDPDNFYSEGYQHFGVRGPTGAGHENRSEVDLSTLVLTRQAARNLAGSVLRRTWINSTTYELELPASYWHLLENDVLSWTDDESIVHVCRIIKIDRGLNWVIKITAVAEDIAGAYIGSAVQSGASQELAFTDQITSIDPIILDIPAVFDIETRAPGLYLGVAGPTGSEFRGCTIYESQDAGTTYNAIGSITRQTVAGVTQTALDAYTSQSWTAGSASVTWDNTSTVQVQLYGGTLSSYTQAQVLAGENWALIGNEIVAFTTATLDGPNTYTLSGFLRNLRDQINQPDIDADQHVAGEQFVLLTRFEANGKFRTYPGPANVGQALRFKFVAPGQNLVDVAHQSVTLKARNALPFAPYASTLTWEPNDDAMITMTPWTNRNVAIGSVGPYTFDDTIEEYVVRIYTNNTYTTETASSPYTVTTRLTGAARLRDRWVTYPKASVISDGFTAGVSTIYYTIEQVGDYGTSRRKRFQG